MEPYRERIEDFIRRWRSRYEGNRVFRVLAVAVAILLALLVLRKFRVLAAPLLIGAILVAGWLLVGSLKTSVLIPPAPRLSPDGPVVRNGVAVVVACGKKREFGAVESAPEPRTGTWGVERRGECSVYYHHPPGWEQRHARHERAQREHGHEDVAGRCARDARPSGVAISGSVYVAHDAGSSELR